MRCGVTRTQRATGSDPGAYFACAITRRVSRLADWYTLASAGEFTRVTAAEGSFCSQARRRLREARSP